MKSNYIKSAEIKIAKNPNMSEEEKYLLMQNARNKRMGLAIKLGTAQKIYISTDSYAKEFRAQSYTIDDLYMHSKTDYWRPTYTTTTTPYGVWRSTTTS
jgi:hypothetical protein